MAVKLVISLVAVFSWAERDSTVPESTLDDLFALLHDVDWSIKFFQAAVELFQTMLLLVRVKTKLFVASKAKRCGRIKVVSPWQPNKMLSKVFFGDRYDALFVDESRF
jgi:hypothetical protein